MKTLLEVLMGLKRGERISFKQDHDLIIEVEMRTVRYEPLAFNGHTAPVTLSYKLAVNSFLMREAAIGSELYIAHKTERALEDVRAQYENLKREDSLKQNEGACSDAKTGIE